MYKIVKKLIDDSLNGIDVYYHNGDIWFIFTETKQWVLEFEKNGNLWYNYRFFKNLFSYLSMDVVENQEHITRYVEDILQNGVKHTFNIVFIKTTCVEDILQNGVKHTLKAQHILFDSVEDILQNGVKDTVAIEINANPLVEDILQNGVKDTREGIGTEFIMVEDVLQNGIKEIKTLDMNLPLIVGDVIDCGVKTTEPGGYLGFVEIHGRVVHQFESPSQNNEVTSVLQNGEKL